MSLLGLSFNIHNVETAVRQAWSEELLRSGWYVGQATGDCFDY